jgi:hypothetical protein
MTGILAISTPTTGTGASREHSLCRQARGSAVAALVRARARLVGDSSHGFGSRSA